MAVTVVWDTWLKPRAEAEGLRLTRQVWSDMRSFEGYLSHQILVDHDAPGDVIALARWEEPGGCGSSNPEITINGEAAAARLASPTDRRRMQIVEEAANYVLPQSSGERSISILDRAPRLKVIGGEPVPHPGAR